ncbi:MAG: DoxX family membrane protein [Thermomicrobiales bacterium]
MNRIYRRLHHVNALVTGWLARNSIPLLRISLGLVFLGFGALKFFPDLSPAEQIAKETMDRLTLGLVPGSAGIVLVAAMETAIGLSLITGRHLRLGMTMLGMAMIGVLSPLVLFPDELFSRQYNAPTLEGQYVVKDIVLLAGGLVLKAGGDSGRIVTDEDAEGEPDDGDA